MDVDRVFTTIPLGVTKTLETQQSNRLEEIVDTCIRPDRNWLCCLRHLAPMKLFVLNFEATIEKLNIQGQEKGKTGSSESSAAIIYINSCSYWCES